ncbi:alpha/beta hydrolase fold domain-containing protein [Macrococcus bovicus]|uniref:Alpha/beta hydrolase n=1 Tax=Macrococcus bovicus TaxID=69968 RepID=A0A4R6C282_9STAP|nr:alpha/beta hydrolase [Macrococcus bovicus]TDM14929.1 alpha/beta hydrolase [Macrococcus bovicus]
MSIVFYDKKRSISSHLLETILRSLGTKKIYSSYHETRNLVLNKKEKKTEYKAKKRFFSRPVALIRKYNMKVYMINDQKDSNQKTILYIHGGAWMNQPLWVHWNFIEYMARHLEAKIIVPIYPKIPHHNYYDAYSSLLLLYSDIIETITDRKKFTVMGDSAGANIILGLIQMIEARNLREPQNIILLSACVDMTFSNPDIRKYEKSDPRLAPEGLKVIAEFWAGQLDVENPILSPIFGKFNTKAKFIHFIGTHDILYPDAVKFDRKLTEEGMDITTFVYPKMNHVFPVLPVKEASHARKKIIEILHS